MRSFGGIRGAATLDNLLGIAPMHHRPQRRQRDSAHQGIAASCTKGRSKDDSERAGSRLWRSVVRTTIRDACRRGQQRDHRRAQPQARSRPSRMEITSPTSASPSCQRSVEGCFFLAHLRERAAHVQMGVMGLAFVRMIANASVSSWLSFRLLVGMHVTSGGRASQQPVAGPRQGIL